LLPLLENCYLDLVEVFEQQAIRERQQIGRWDRVELEDKYISLSEEHLTLKRVARKQEEKIKK